MSNGVQVMTPAQMANAIAGYTAGLPKPYTDQQVSAKAKALLDPVVAGITSRIGAQTKASTGALAGYANEAANRLGAYGDSAKNIYGSAESAQAAANAAEAEGLRGTGTQLAEGLAGKIGQITADPAAAAAAMPNTAGAANALYGIGSASLDKLIGEGTAAQDYAAKLPGLQRAQGQSDIRDVTLASQKNQADQIATAEQQLPGLVQGLRSESDTRAANIASTRNQATQYLEGRNDANTKFLQAEKDAGINATTRATATVTAAKIRAATAQETAQAKASETSFKNRLSFAKTYGYDPVTNQTVPGFSRDKSGHVVKVATAAAAKTGKAASPKGQLTQAQSAKLVQQWHDGKTTPITTELKDKNGQPAVNPTTGKPITETKTAVVGNLKYGQAYAMLRTFGKTDTEARALLNTVYGKGDSGRSWVTNDEQAALKKAGIPYQAKLVKAADGSQRGLLGPRQVATLKKAGLLPPGQPTAEGWYVIAPGN